MSTVESLIAADAAGLGYFGWSGLSTTGSRFSNFYLINSGKAKRACSLLIQ
jgi:hypothetical protein